MNILGLTKNIHFWIKASFTLLQKILEFMKIHKRYTYIENSYNVCFQICIVAIKISVAPINSSFIGNRICTGDEIWNLVQKEHCSNIPTFEK